MTHAAAQAHPSQESLRIAYLTNQYPAVSHTFIRRELREIERRGHAVHRFAIRRSATDPIDPADKEEFSRTFHVLSRPKWELGLATIRAAISRPSRFLRACKATASLAKRSDRGLLRHMAYLAEAARLLPELQKHRIEHVHVHFGTNAAAVGMLARLLGGPPYSITIHGPDEFDAPVGLSLSDKVAGASFICAISDFCSSQIRRWIAPQQWGKVHVIRCTVGESYSSAATSIPPDSRSLVCVGRFNAQKGHRSLLEGFALAVREGADARLVLCGDGELRGEIETFIRENGLGDRVEITGWVDEAEVRRRIEKSRGLILPSFAEGLPMVIMEAFALGRPVISSRLAGIPELVEHGRSGWLVTPGRADQVAAAIQELMSAPIHRLQEMAAIGRKAVLERHNTVVEGERLDRLFQSHRGAK